MFMLSKTINQQTKDSEERWMIQMKRSQHLLTLSHMEEIEGQALTVHTTKNYKKEKKENYHHNKKKDKKQKNIKRDPSNVRCYTYDEKGHFVRDYPIKKKRHHAACFQR